METGNLLANPKISNDSGTSGQCAICGLLRGAGHGFNDCRSVNGPIIDPLANIPVFDNPKFIRFFFSQLKRVKVLIHWSDSQIFNTILLRVEVPLVNFFLSFGRRPWQ